MSLHMNFNPDVFLFLVFAAYGAGMLGALAMVGLVRLRFAKSDPQRAITQSLLFASFAPMNSLLLPFATASAFLSLAYFTSAVTAVLSALALNAAFCFVVIGIEAVTLPRRQ